MNAISRSGLKGAIRSGQVLRRGRESGERRVSFREQTAFGLICSPNDLSNAAADCQMPLPDKRETNWQDILNTEQSEQQEWQ